LTRHKHIEQNVTAKELFIHEKKILAHNNRIWAFFSLQRKKKCGIFDVDKQLYDRFFAKSNRLNYFRVVKQSLIIREIIMSTTDNISNALVQNWEDKVILVVEDVDTNKIFFDAALRKTKAKIIWAKDGQEAVTMFKENVVDLVLMDLQLPIMDGYTATRHIKAINPNIPIIAQTAHVMSGEREKCIEAGCDDYLAKPIRLQILMDTLSKFLNK
jgi:two-component system cell cycle response regulator DivK